MLFEVLYYIFIFPLEQVLDVIIDVFYRVTKDYGLSIVLLSVCINLFLLKLVLYFDTRAKIINIRKKECDNKIAEFKRVFKGAELQTYIRTLYRQKHFHPIYTLQGLGGLALQIPFFIAIIHLIQNATYLKDVSFLWITDLSKADSVMLFGVSLHILPLLVTLFTLINVFYSTKDKGARIQGIFIALIFLVLLYDMPSSLVLYWTCNMLFSLFKEIYKAYLRKKESLDFDTLDSKDSLPASNITLQDIQIQSVSNAQQIQSHKSKYSLIFSRIFTPYSALDSKVYTTYRNISIFAILNICFMICVFNPFAIYSSDVSQFDNTQTYQTLGTLFGFFLLSSFVLIYSTSFFYKSRLLKIMVFGISVILCIGLVYTFVLVGDYGAMDHFMLQRLNFINPDFKMQKYISFFVTVCGSILLAIFFMRWLQPAWKILFITLCIGGIFYFIEIIYAKQDYLQSYQVLNDSNGQLQPYEKELFSYSKTEKNIVVMVLDMFSGSHMSAILEQFPHFKKSLDGFTLFDNTISTTNSTIHSVSSIIGGEYYAVYNMNARKENLIDGINEAFGIIGDTFIKNGYDVGYFIPNHLSASFDKVKTYNNSITLVRNNSVYLGYYYQSNPLIKEKINEYIDKKDTTNFLLLSVGLFRFVPELFFRPRIYNHGAWLLGDKNFANSQVALEFASSFYAFTHLHNTQSNKPTFKYLHSLMTHLPFTLFFKNGECVPFTQNSVFNEYSHNNIINIPKEYKNPYFQHYDTEVCALSYLSSFIRWLKENGIYDNTQIFVLSDHSGFDSIGIPYFVSIDEHRPDALFLFKDFAKSGALTIDSRLMTNYDAPSIFCENLPNGCHNVPKNILKYYPKNRNVISTIPVHWDISQHKKNQWLISFYFQVSGDIYNEVNWRDITQEVKNGTFKIDGIEH